MSTYTAASTGAAYGVDSSSGAGTLAAVHAATTGGSSAITASASSTASNHTINATCDISAGYAAILGTHTNGGTGLYAQSNTTDNTGSNAALIAKNTSSGTALYASSSSGYGVYASAPVGVKSVGTGASGIGVQGYGGVGGTGVYGFALVDSSGIGVWGEATASTSSATVYAVYGNANGGGGTSVAYGVYGTAAAGGTNWAGYFDGNAKIAGNLTVTGSLSVTGTPKSFLIDHPLDAPNKYLAHACVESPDMKNIYDGTAVADDSGEAVVELPAYFEALNTSFRYQLTALGAPAPDVHIKSEVTGARFAIAGANPGQRICWQVTGVRNDPAARANPLIVEREKTASEKGLYLNPLAHGEPESKQIGGEEQQRARERSKARSRRSLEEEEK
jgi:hypothetical protein